MDDEGINMVQRQVVILEDDLDGGEAVETVSFSVDGVAYEIDLNADNAAKLRDDFAPWVGAARKATGRKPAARRQAPATGAARKREIAAIREWGRENGWKVSERGRLSADLEEAYAKANG
ncbi:Lsr2 family protein [Kytococcus sedentarius]|uniref:histone-like nucleoid-structuring protein Lsr2 n=1 Tax=Kytococcus sedentarius TaxID=1276 RepID=UPI0035BB9E93